MNIIRMVKNHTRIHGWPSESIRLGPATCGQPRYSDKRSCRTVHAYAEAVEYSIIREEVGYVFIYHRPCNMHDDSRVVRGIEYGE